MMIEEYLYQKHRTMNLSPIMRNLDPSEPSMRVFDNYVTINSAAAGLLGVQADGYVQFRFDKVSSMGGRVRLFIGRADNGSMAFRMTGRKGRTALYCYSRVLAHYLSESLEGFGHYRICPEDKAEGVEGDWFGIFHKRYD